MSAAFMLSLAEPCLHVYTCHESTAVDLTAFQMHDHAPAIREGAAGEQMKVMKLKASKSTSTFRRDSNWILHYSLLVDLHWTPQQQGPGTTTVCCHRICFCIVRPGP